MIIAIVINNWVLLLHTFSCKFTHLHIIDLIEKSLSSQLLVDLHTHRMLRNCGDSCGTSAAFRSSAYRLYDTVLAIRSHEKRRHQLFGIGVDVVIDRLLIVRCKIGWFFFRRSTLTQDRSSLRDAIYGRIRLPNAHSLHWSITKAAFGSILPGGLSEQRCL